MPERIRSFGTGFEANGSVTSPFAVYLELIFCLLWLSTFNLQLSTEFFRLSAIPGRPRSERIAAAVYERGCVVIHPMTRSEYCLRFRAVPLRRRPIISTHASNAASRENPLPVRRDARSPAPHHRLGTSRGRGGQFGAGGNGFGFWDEGDNRLG